MKNRWVVLGIAAVVILFLGGTCVSRYNGLVKAREQTTAAWAQVQNVLQRRADLIPNLVETVKGYAAHEKEIFTAVAEARAKLLAAHQPAEAAAADGQLQSALGRLLAIAEAYPDLKANQSFLRLQDELAGTENRIAVERMRYNDEVRAYNTSLQTFPNSLFAGIGGFHAAQYFEAEAGAATVPKVQFGS
jgi:LemA protein